MCKFSGKIMMLAATALFLSVGTAVAGQSSSDWNNSWGFPSTFEKSRLVEQALAIEFVEEDGFDNTSTYFGTNDTYIGGNYVGTGGILQIDNSINDSVLGSFNTSDSYNKTKTTTTTTNINKTIQNSNNTTQTNTTQTNINKNINVNK
jgi:hypothetical protein